MNCRRLGRRAPAALGLVARGVIPRKNIKFIAAIPGGGSLVQAVIDGQIQAFEFATPLDDVSQLFGLREGNPGTVGTRYLHFPGWHQQFLITYMIVNKTVWNRLSAAQQALVMSVGRDHVVSSYGENLRQQGSKLKEILMANDNDGIDGNELVLVQWPQSDLALLRDATIQVLNARAFDPALSEQDRKDYGTILETLRKYASDNNAYWKVRDVPSDGSPPPPRARPRHWAWAQLMERAFGVDVLACPRCAGRLRLVATVDNPQIIRAILESLGLPGQASPPHPP